MRFLLVEDNPQLAAAILDRLGQDGHVVDHASDLATAADYTATTGYDLILLDIMSVSYTHLTLPTILRV